MTTYSFPSDHGVSIRHSLPEGAFIGRSDNQPAIREPYGIGGEAMGLVTELRKAAARALARGACETDQERLGIAMSAGVPWTVRANDAGDKLTIESAPCTIAFDRRRAIVAWIRGVELVTASGGLGPCD